MKEAGSHAVSVFAVWQPMLPTDWGAPTAGVLKRMPDGGVRQYWDPNHLIAKTLAADARSPQPEPDCCERDEILWDLVAVYPPGVRWEDRLPTAVMINGPVVNVAEELSTNVRKLSRPH